MPRIKDLPAISPAGAGLVANSSIDQAGLVPTSAFVGVGDVSIAVTTDDITLDDVQQQSLDITLTGALTGNRNILLMDDQNGVWFFHNNTTGSYTITVKPVSGAGVVIDQGKSAIIYSDGTDGLAIFNSGDYYTAAETDSLIDAVTETELSKEMIATGSITQGDFVALRPDGTVEAIAGSETLASIGADNTSLLAVTSMRYLDAVYNATSGKVAVLYYDASANNTIYVAIGTVSGTTIAFGAPQTFTGGTGATYWDNGRIVWNVAGDKVVVAFEGATGYPSFVCASVSGTALTFGSVVQSGTTTITNNTFTYFGHDDTHGSRVVLYVLPHDFIVAATYTGTTMTVGAQAAFNPSVDDGFVPIFDHANARFIGISANGTTLYARCATVSTTTWSVGSEVSTTAIVRFQPVLDTSSGKVGILGLDGTSSGLPYSSVLTFSGTTTTINTPAKVANYSLTSTGFQAADNQRAPCAYEATSGKLVFTGRVDDSSDDNGIAVFVGTISGTSMTIGAPAFVIGANTNNVGMFAKGSNSDLALLYQDIDDFNRFHIAHAKIVSGEFVVQDDFLMRSVPPTKPEASIGSDQRITRTIQAGWSLMDFNTWGVSGNSNTMTCFRVILPTETTNADDWIGAAQDTVTNGQTCSIRMRGGVADHQTGMTVGDDYFLKGDGTRTTTDNGRYVGRALSATALLMESL